MQCVDRKGRLAPLAYHILHLDETWINTGDCVEKLWVHKNFQSKHDAFIKGLTTGTKNPTGKKGKFFT